MNPVRTLVRVLGKKGTFFKIKKRSLFIPKRYLFEQKRDFFQKAPYYNQFENVPKRYLFEQKRTFFQKAPVKKVSFDLEIDFFLGRLRWSKRDPILKKIEVSF